MKLKDLLNQLKIGSNYCSVNLIEKIQDCQRINYRLNIEVFDSYKFDKWCKENNIIYGIVEREYEQVYRLDRFN
jgi:phage pi2 protein 07